jgi:hypothetical protein
MASGNPNSTHFLPHFHRSLVGSSYLSGSHCLLYRCNCGNAVYSTLGEQLWKEHLIRIGKPSLNRTSLYLGLLLVAVLGILFSSYFFN